MARRATFDYEAQNNAIRRYYQSVDHNDLWLPQHAQWRQIRFFIWDEKEQRIRYEIEGFFQEYARREESPEATPDSIRPASCIIQLRRG